MNLVTEVFNFNLSGFPRICAVDCDLKLNQMR